MEKIEVEVFRNFIGNEKGHNNESICFRCRNYDISNVKELFIVEKYGVFPLNGVNTQSA